MEKFLQACDAHWPEGQARPRVLTRAPGRLDCMGGMADFSGTLALQMPIKRAVCVAAGRRNDQRLEVYTIGWNDAEGRSVYSWPLSLFYQSDGQFVTGARLAEAFPEAPWTRHIAGVCLALLESGEIPHFAGGATLLIQSDIPSGVGLAASAAIQVATAKAMAALFEIDLTPEALLRACRSAAVEVSGSLDGLVDHVTCLLGESDALLQIRCQGTEAIGQLPLPREVTLAAVSIGSRLPIYAQRYEDNRVACLMGQYLVERLLGSGHNGDLVPGCLANIPPSEYVRRLRNDLPVKMRGRDFLAAHKEPTGLEGRIQPEQIYKVRSRTEHHIYENDRTHRLMERLARARRTGERDALVEAGELMYASHWSYGQRCGMGSIETDVLVNCIRAHGPARGLYGAKITAGGCGGTVAVLMADTAAARAALDEACAAYAEKTGNTASILMGSSPGAAAFGHKYLD